MVKQVKPLEYKEEDSGSGGKMPQPNSYETLKFLTDLATKTKSQQISDSEFFEAVGETFKSNPKFFMKELYKGFMEKMLRTLEADKRWDMEKYILEKYCLDEDEKIIYELSGNIKQTELIEQKPSGKYKMKNTPVTLSVSSGGLYFTNYRVIAQGKLKVSGGHNTSLLSSFTPALLKRYAWTGNTTQAIRRKKSFGSSSVFGYQFPTKNHWGLGKSKLLNIVAYSVNIGKFKCTISVKPTIKNSTKRKEHLNNIFDMLRKDADEVLDVIHEIFETEILEKSRRRYSLAILKQLLKSEEFMHLSDSDFLDIAKATYKLDPEFFMSSIFPKMAYWDFPSFLSVKEELFEILRNEGANIN